LVYTCTVTANGLKGVMGYTTQSPSFKGRFMAARAASLDEAATDLLLGPAREASVGAAAPVAGVPLPAEVISVPVLTPV
jgi:hypothetical protein